MSTHETGDPRDCRGPGPVALSVVAVAVAAIALHAQGGNVGPISACVKNSGDMKIRTNGACRPVAKGILPVDRGHHSLDVGGRKSRSVEAADDRAHAGARDGIHGNVILFENLEHADVGRAARTAT